MGVIRKLALAVLAAGLLWAGGAQAQQTVIPCYTLNTNPNLASPCQIVSSTNPLPVSASITPVSNQSVNITQIGGVSALAGAGATGTGSLRVTAAQDTTTIAGSAPGTAGTASANVVSVQGIASMTPLLVNPGTATNFGLYAQGSTTSGQLGDLNQCAVTTTAPTYVTAQTSPLSCDVNGGLTVSPYAKPGNFTSGVTAAMTGTTSTSLLGAPAGSLRNYLTHLVCTNSHATVGTFVLVQDGSGGTTIYEAYAAAVGGGFSLSLPTPLKQPTAATALFVQDVTTGSNVICSGSGYQGL